MNIQEAIVKSAYITDSAIRAHLITMLVSGEVEICDNCGFSMKPGTMCEVCENEWADQMAAHEEEMSWGRAAMTAPRY